MTVKMGKRGTIPNWITENDWSAEQRLEWLNKIIVSSPRDWDIPEKPDPEIWAIYCLVTSEKWDDAVIAWWDYCDNNSL